MSVKIKKVLKLPNAKILFNQTLSYDAMWDVITKSTKLVMWNKSEIIIGVSDDNKKLWVQTTSGIKYFSLRDKMEFLVKVDNYYGKCNIYIEVLEINYEESFFTINLYSDKKLNEFFVIKDENDLEEILNDKFETELNVKFEKESFKLNDKKIGKSLRMNYNAIDKRLYEIQKYKTNNLTDCFQNAIVHRNIGFFCEGYFEVAISGLYKTDISTIVNKFSVTLKDDFTNLEISNRSDMFKFIFYDFEEVELYKVKTLKIHGVKKENYLNVLNKIIFILNISNINMLPSNSYEFASIKSIERSTKKISYAKSTWERTFENNNSNSTAMIYHLTGLNYSNGDFHSFLQGYRSVESMYQIKINASENLKELLKNNNYKFLNKSINEEQIIQARDNLVHNETGKNLKIIMNDELNLYNNIKKELDNIFKKSIKNKNIKYPRTFLDLKTFSLENFFFYKKKKKYGEIVIKMKGLDELYKKNELGRKTITDSENNKIEFEISEPSIEFQKKYPKSQNQYTLKVMKVKESEFIRQVFEVLNHFALITLESVNDKEINDMMFPIIRNDENVFYIKYNNIRYTKIKDENISTILNVEKLHHFNDAIDATNNTQFENYYLFIQSFFSSKNNYTNHSIENKKIFNIYWNAISYDVKSVYINKMKKNNLSIDPESAASFFSKFRNNTFHANLEFGQQNLFHIDDEILVQTMMAREICIQLLNDKCIS